MRRALIVVGKAPVPGQAKTRLVPPLTPEDAAGLYAGFLRDTLDTAVQLGWEHTTVVHPRGDGALLARLLPGVTLLEQTGVGLGHALASAFAHHLSSGADRVILIGSDNPTLPIDLVRSAAAALQADDDVAIGPTTDGGYYLIGMRQLHLTLFENIEWSTSRVYAQTLQRAAALNLSAHAVGEWYDVDEPADLERLRAELRCLPESVAPHTRRALEGIALRPEPAAAASAPNVPRRRD